MTKNVEKYLNEHQHKEVIDIIFQRMINKNKVENFKDFQIPALMEYVAFQILQPSMEHRDIITMNEEYIKEYLMNMRKEFENA